jgi:hypothetical protein
MPVLTAAQLLEKLGDRPHKRLAIPELGGDVLIQKLSAEDRGQLDVWIADYRDNAAKKGDDPEGWRLLMRPKIISLCLVDEAGKPLFSEQQLEDLAEGAVDLVERLYDECRHYNRLMLTDAEKKSSAGTPTGVSTTG